MIEEKKAGSRGYNSILIEDLSECSRLFGTDEYRPVVHRLRHDVVNIKNGPQLRTMVDEYADGEWWDGIEQEFKEWNQANPLMDKNDCETEKEMIINNRMSLLCDFIRNILVQHSVVKLPYLNEEHD